ncbi:EAL domain-containing protein [Klebsiella pneumoniae]|uniref:EAL domain-containing protein n=1 Tax=Klebsiella pneumoniae TaxID=573 RepID=UPI00081BCA81|nr:hypothetical protein A6D78_25665 [Klebsiella pneumoniae]
MIFAPAFQPIKDVGTGSFVAAEVLARWYDEGRVLTPSSLSSPPYWGLVDMEMARFIQDSLLWSSFFGHADQMVGLCTGGQLGGRAGQRFVLCG